MRIYAKTTKLCIFALKKQQHLNTPPSMQAQLKLSGKTETPCGILWSMFPVSFSSDHLRYSNLWICWGKFLEYFISYYWYIIDHTQNWKHSHRFPQWNSTKTKNLCKNASQIYLSLPIYSLWQSSLNTCKKIFFCT